jgi:hypothetical protein
MNRRRDDHPVRVATVSPVYNDGVSIGDEPGGRMPERSDQNTLGNTSLGLGIASAALVFGLGICALVGAQQGWIALLITPLYVCGISSAFLGLIAAGLGTGGLLAKGRMRGTAIAGLVLGVLGICMFFFVVSRFGG